MKAKLSISSLAGLACAAALTLAASAPAQAHGNDVYFSVGMAAPGMQISMSNAPAVVVAAPPVVYAPPPVVYTPPPVVYAPPPVVYPSRQVIYAPPAPVYYGPPPAWGRHRGWEHERGWERRGWDRGYERGGRYERERYVPQREVRWEGRAVGRGDAERMAGAVLGRR